MSAALLSSIDGMVAVLAGIESRMFTSEQCVALVGRLARLERVCAATRTRLAVRAIECGAHKESGIANGAE